jgi:hypothetical protein
VRRIGHEFEPGSIVLIKDLARAVGFNGTSATVQSFDADAGRYVVSVKLAGEETREIKVRPENLKLQVGPPKLHAPRLTTAMRAEDQQGNRMVGKRVEIYGLPTPTSKASSRLWNSCIGTLDGTLWPQSLDGELCLEGLVWMGHKHVRVPVANMRLAANQGHAQKWERFEAMPESGAARLKPGQSVLLGPELGMELKDITGTITARSPSGSLVVQVGCKSMTIDAAHLRPLREAEPGVQTAAEKRREDVMLGHLLTCKSLQ